jgi:hypothetical protein
VQGNLLLARFLERERAALANILTCAFACTLLPAHVKYTGVVGGLHLLRRLGLQRLLRRLCLLHL